MQQNGLIPCSGLFKIITSLGLMAHGSLQKDSKLCPICIGHWLKLLGWRLYVWEHMICGWKPRCLGIGRLFAQTWQLELIPEKSFPSLLPQPSKLSSACASGSCHSLITANSSSLSASKADLSNWVGAEEVWLVTLCCLPWRLRKLRSSVSQESQDKIEMFIFCLQISQDQKPV